MTADTHRTFLAVYPDPATIRLINDKITGLRERFGGIRWTPEHQLHFTLRFFGNLDDKALATAARVLEDNAPRTPALSFPLNSLGAFPDWRRPRIFWIGAGAGGDDLEAVARRLDIAFGEAGLGRADKPFRAHLTIGRLREGESLERPEIDALRGDTFSTPPFEVADLRLMLSRLGPRGATHEVFRTIRLANRST
jgi:RNA 2',3'-cyclic 3'-phosphodiesterase